MATNNRVGIGIGTYIMRMGGTRPHLNKYCYKYVHRAFKKSELAILLPDTLPIDPTL